MWIKISGKGGSIFLVLNLFTFFKKGKIMVPKDAIKVFPDKFIPEIDFTDKPVVPCDVPE